MPRGQVSPRNFIAKAFSFCRSAKRFETGAPRSSACCAALAPDWQSGLGGDIAVEQIEP